mgnify:FL=1
MIGEISHKLVKKNILKIESFTKLYGDIHAVQNLSLEVDKGEIYGFLGPNGAGKTTTIRSILNFIYPTEGKISVFGMDSRLDSVEIKRNIGYLAGDISLYGNMNGIKLFKYLTKLGKTSDWNYIHHLSEQFEAVLERKISSLSKGNKQKIGLIQAFMHKPEFLILDEPTSGLDPLMKQSFYDLVLDVKSLGTTVFVSSHDLTEVQKICDRVGFIKDGKLIASENIKNNATINLRRYGAEFQAPPDENIFEGIPNVTDIERQGTRLIFTVTGNVSAALSAVVSQQPVDLREEDTNLEDLFMKYYE